MTVTLDWTVKIGGVASPTDFTDRVRGVNIRQNVVFHRPSTTTATIELLNDDGALTPTSGGGTGTYASTDWFAQAVFISCEATGGASSTTAEVFHGLIAGFDLADDGTFSTVRITVVDALSIVGRANINPVYTLPSSTVMVSNISAAITQINNLTPVPLPKLGKTSTLPSAIIVSKIANPDAPVYNSSNADSPARVSDLLTRQLMPAGLCAVWATRIVESADTLSAEYDFLIVGPGLNREAGGTGNVPFYAGARNFVFDESGGGTDEIPFRDLVVGYNEQHLVNVATFENYNDTQSGTAINSSSVGKYGTQAFQTTNNIMASSGGSGANPEIWQYPAYDIVNRFGDIIFAPMAVSFTAATLIAADDSAQTAVAYLLDAAGLFQPATVTWQPTGGSSVTAEVVIMGRQINVTPSNTTVTLTFRPASTLTSFQLNSSTLGVLGEDRLSGE